MVAAKCISEQVGHENERRRGGLQSTRLVARFFVATQDPELLAALRRISGVPLVRLNGPVPQLEEPSQVTRSEARGTEQRKRSAAGWEKAKMPELQARNRGGSTAFARLLRLLMVFDIAKLMLEGVLRLPGTGG